eukprot:TRINITY_DN3143_c0_g1_i2.p1 TRINITY_DN3143_c0_g1~~TRINITY_DN3143_c0_g1_i2.p1  ORF type:complete len:593 (-),score=86.63 TRINITY_DN3143_c0_g1_i2:39-1817(-)
MVISGSDGSAMDALPQEYNPPQEISECEDGAEEWSELVRKIQPFERDVFRRKTVLTQPTDIERTCAQVLAEQLGLNCSTVDDDVVISKPSAQDHEARKVLIEFCHFPNAVGMNLPPLDSFELECFQTQGEMLGLETVRREDSSIYVYKQNASEAEPELQEPAEQANSAPSMARRLSNEWFSPQMRRTKSLCRLRSSLHRSTSFCDFEAASEMRRSHSQLPDECRTSYASLSLSEDSSNGAPPPVPPAKRLGLQRIESQRVLDQTATLSSSIQNTSFSMLEPQKECVWYINGQTDSDGNIGVFKSEEPDLMPSTSAVSSGSRNGFGENSGYVREVAAYKLDHKAWVGVPPTIAYSLTVEGQAVEGSVQSFIDHNHSADEDDARNPGGWRDHHRYPEHQVHKVGVLDIRLFNTDRHGGNLLVREQDDEVVLVPIDHGLCLPDYRHLEMPTQPVWFLWEQATLPFNDDVVQYVEGLSLEEDVEILEKEGLEPESIVTFRLVHTLLQGAVVGMSPCCYTLRDLGELVVQNMVDRPSIFQSWVQQGIAEEAGGFLESPVGWFEGNHLGVLGQHMRICLLYTFPSPRDRTRFRVPASA